MRMQKMKVSCLLLVFIIFASEWITATAYHPDFSWKNMDAFMTGDLKYRMMKKIPTRRRYCDCDDVDAQDRYPVCASNKALYENACLFQCAKVRWPSLEEVDIALCGPETFKEFKQSEFRPHY